MEQQQVIEEGNKKSLGQTLRRFRAIKQLTLRQVEEALGISNAYLSQLENDKIKKPSANILYKLSSLYCVNIDVLLIASGIISETQSVNPLTPNSVFGKIPLTPKEEEELLKYLNFLRFGK